MKKVEAEMCKAVKASEQNGLGMLIELFDWLDGLEPQPTTVMPSIRGELQTAEEKIANAPRPMGQVTANKEKISVSLHLGYTLCFQLALVE